MRIQNVVVVSGFAMLTACAGVQEVSIDPSTFNGGGKNIATTMHSKDGEFSFFTKGDQTAAAVAGAMGAIPIFGVLGAAIAGGTVGAVGQAVKNSRIGFSIDEYSKANNIVDPKNAIEKAIAANMATRYNVSYSGSARTAIDKGASVENVISANQEYPYVLDVTTTRWVLSEGETDLFSLSYSARMLLADTTSKTVLAQGQCNYNSAKSVIELPKLKTNDVSQLNSEMELAVSACVQQISEKYLGFGDKQTASVSH